MDADVPGTVESQIYLVEFEHGERNRVLLYVLQSQIYLVEFKLLIVRPVWITSSSPKSTLWNLNLITPEKSTFTL